jgi:hypothetical protein
LVFFVDKIYNNPSDLSLTIQVKPEDSGIETAPNKEIKKYAFPIHKCEAGAIQSGHASKPKERLNSDVKRISLDSKPDDSSSRSKCKVKERRKKGKIKARLMMDRLDEARARKRSLRWNSQHSSKPGCAIDALADPEMKGNVLTVAGVLEQSEAREHKSRSRRKSIVTSVVSIVSNESTLREMQDLPVGPCLGENLSRFHSASDNVFSPVGRDFEGMVKLIELNDDNLLFQVCGMQIISFPNDFLLNYGMITVLDLSSNKLSSLPASLGCLLSLKEIYLRSNCFQSLPSEMYVLPNLEVIDVSINEISYLGTHNIYFSRGSAPHCFLGPKFSFP